MAKDRLYCSDRIKRSWKKFFNDAPGKVKLILLTTGVADQRLISQYRTIADYFPGLVSLINFDLLECPKLVKVYKLQKIPAVLVFRERDLVETWVNVAVSRENINQAVGRLALILTKSPRTTRTTLPARRTVSPAVRVPATEIGPTGYEASTVRNEQAQTAEVLRLVNRERAKYGLPQLRRNRSLDKIASYHATDMARRNFYDHVNPEGQGPKERMDMLVARGLINPINWRALGENIDKMDPSARHVMASWMNSPHHRENILRSNFTDIGIAVDWPTKHWVQVFAQVAR